MLNKNTKTGKTVEVNCIFFFFAAASATSSPATLGMKERRDSMRDYQSSHSTMQFYNYREDSSNHKKQYTGTLFKAEACCCLLPPLLFLLPDLITIYIRLETVSQVDTKGFRAGPLL